MKLISVMVSLLVVTAHAKDDKKTMPNIYPVKGKVEVPFGTYTDKNKDQQFNAGLEFSTSKGTSVVATDDGNVKSISGDTVTIDNGDDIETVYQPVSEIKVKVGDGVKKGDILGTSSEKLHYEMTMLGIYLDPMAFIP